MTGSEPASMTRGGALLGPAPMRALWGRRRGARRLEGGGTSSISTSSSWSSWRAECELLRADATGRDYATTVTMICPLYQPEEDNRAPLSSVREPWKARVQILRSSVAIPRADADTRGERGKGEGMRRPLGRAGSARRRRLLLQQRLDLTARPPGAPAAGRAARQFGFQFCPCRYRGRSTLRCVAALP